MYAREPKRRAGGQNAAELVGQCRQCLIMTVRLTRRSRSRNGLPGQRERHVEGGRCSATDDVSSDAEPIRRQVRVADPGLLVAGERRPGRHDRPRGRQVQKVAIDYLDLRAEEVVAGGKNDRVGKCDRNLDFLTGKGRRKIERAVHNRVRGREVRGDRGGHKAS